MTMIKNTVLAAGFLALSTGFAAAGGVQGFVDVDRQPFSAAVVDKAAAQTGSRVIKQSELGVTDDDRQPFASGNITDADRELAKFSKGNGGVLGFVDSDRRG